MRRSDADGPAPHLAAVGRGRRAFAYAFRAIQGSCKRSGRPRRCEEAACASIAEAAGGPFRRGARSSEFEASRKRKPADERGGRRSFPLRYPLHFAVFCTALCVARDSLRGGIMGIMGIIWTIIVGLIVGAIARWIMPGRRAWVG
jgi:hypothetical protein